MTAELPAPFTIRPARCEDSPALVRIVDMASEGLALHICGLITRPGQNPLDLAESIVAAGEGTLCWRNGWIAEVDGHVGAGMISFRLGDVPAEPDELLPKLKPLWALERRVQGLYYVYAIATFDEFRGRGLGRALMLTAEQHAESAPSICLIVADRNLPARRLYASLGYVDEASEAIITNGWHCDSQNWILMVKPLSQDDAGL